MVNSFIAKEDLDSEMTVVRNEFESGENSPTNVLLERVLSTAYLWHNYGKSTIGSRADLENVPIDRLQAFYRTLLPARQRGAARRRASSTSRRRSSSSTQYFGAIPKPTRTLPSCLHRRADAGRRARVTLRRVGDVQWVMSAYHVPAGADPDFAAIDLVVLILGDTPSGRLHKALVETKKASQIFGGDFQLHDPGIAYFAAQVRQDPSLDDGSRRPAPDRRSDRRPTRRPPRSSSAPARTS